MNASLLISSKEKDEMELLNKLRSMFGGKKAEPNAMPNTTITPVEQPTSAATPIPAPISDISATSAPAAAMPPVTPVSQSGASEPNVTSTPPQQ